MSFERALGLDEFEERGRSAVWKTGKKQVLVVDVGGTVHALDNRCPHEGYPLSKGTVSEGSGSDGGAGEGACTLTCNWHNWKFRLTDGKCLIGSDNVRVYETKIDDDAIWVDVAPPPREQVIAGIMEGLRKGFEKRNYGQLARELARLTFNEADPLMAIRAGVLWSHDRLEYGMRHSFAALADWLTLYAENRGSREDEIIPLAEALDHMADDALRQPRFPFPESSLAYDEAEFLAAIEAEDDPRASALALGAWESGLGFTELKPTLARAALSHYADFGHALIWVYKAGAVAAVLQDRDVDRALLLAVTRSLCYATREDLIPEFREYGPSLARVVAGETGETGAAAPELFGASVGPALDWTVAALAGRPPEAVYDDLLRANAQQMLHYDLAFNDHVDRSVSSNVGWLDFTHALTFANAARVLCAEQPVLWPQALLQMACFVGRNSPFMDRDLDVSPWDVADEDAFRADVKARLMDHGVPVPIYSSHLLKTALAVFEETPVASAATRAALLASLHRFLNSPLKAKHVRRLVRQGIDLVARDY